MALLRCTATRCAQMKNDALFPLLELLPERQHRFPAGQILRLDGFGVQGFHRRFKKGVIDFQDAILRLLGIAQNATPRDSNGKYGILAAEPFGRQPRQRPGHPAVSAGQQVFRFAVEAHVPEGGIVRTSVVTKMRGHGGGFAWLIQGKPDVGIGGEIGVVGEHGVSLADGVGWDSYWWRCRSGEKKNPLSMTTMGL